MKSISTSITINAPVTEVWEALMQFDAYPEWNPFVRQISGSASNGEQLHVTIQGEGQKPMSFQPTVLQSIPNREFRWKGKLFVKGLFDGEHFFKLESIGVNRTKLIHGEQFTGLMTTVLLKMIGESTQKGFIAMNEALKSRH